MRQTRALIAKGKSERDTFAAGALKKFEGRRPMMPRFYA
jgi:hypothetical protein